MLLVTDDLKDCIGKTPLLELKRLFPHGATRVYAKLENMNPMSIKDRAVLSMVTAAMQDGRITPETEVVEASSGNTAIALAMLGVLLGFLPREYRLPVLAALTLMTIMVVVACAGLFFFTGLDPLGLFAAAGDQVARSVPIATDTVDDWWQVYFTDPHATTGHEFKHKSVSQVISPEYDFINGVLFQYWPRRRFGFFKQLFQDRGITWVLEFRIECAYNKIEEGIKVCVPVSFGCLFGAIGELG